ncbi:FAD:protein FMN transferase [Thalassolituus sp. UBA3500]|uniref:FAD:protein FMN transferase n=1 Tax=Thalassolituus sp. UBA3500 TaxID=1947664 RepID=UPI00263AFE2B|nr:FAD:protein FMN transferase [Thalassolituus sp. UBA3500]
MSTKHSDARATYLAHEFRAMASPCCFHLPAGTPTDVIHAMEAEVRRIEAKYSRYRDDSVLSDINQRAGQKVGLDNETLWLINYACACFEQSDGLFDISSGVLRQAWDFRAGQLPSEATLARLLPRIGLSRIEISEAHLTMPPDMELDLGGIGKEYAVDAAAKIAREAGINRGVVDLGGDLCVLGPHADGSPWQLGVRNPRDTESAIASLPVYQGGMASSGDYERFFEIDGKRYCHLLNARTGLPVEYWASVTVIAPSCLLAGTLSSIAMLKQESGEDWLRSQEVNALLIRPDLSLLSLTDR